jgi:hypothetical protein
MWNFVSQIGDSTGISPTMGVVVGTEDMLGGMRPMQRRLLKTIPNEVWRQERPGRRGMSNLSVYIPNQDHQDCEIGDLK